MTDQNNVAGFEPAVLETEDLDLVAGGEGGGMAGSGHRDGGGLTLSGG